MLLAQLAFAQCMCFHTDAVNLESMFGSAASGVSSAVSQVNGAASTVASNVGKGVSSFAAQKKSTMPTCKYFLPANSASTNSPSAAVTVSATNPSQQYNKAIGTLLTYGASASLLSQYASSNGGSSFLASVSSSVSKSNTVHQFNIQGSSVGTTAGAVTTATGSDYGTKPNAAPTLVPMAGCALYFSILVGIVGAGVVFL